MLSPGHNLIVEMDTEIVSSRKLKSSKVALILYQMFSNLSFFIVFTLPLDLLLPLFWNIMGNDKGSLFIFVVSIYTFQLLANEQRTKPACVFFINNILIFLLRFLFFA